MTMLIIGFLLGYLLGREEPKDKQWENDGNNNSDIEQIKHNNKKYYRV